MADKKDNVHGGKKGDSLEQDKKQKDPNTDEDPQREKDKNQHSPSEDNPDDFDK